MTLASIMNSPEFLNNDRLRVTRLSLIVSEYQHLPERTCTEILLTDTERGILGTVFWDDIDKHDLSISAGIHVKINDEFIAHHYEHVLQITKLELPRVRVQHRRYSVFGDMRVMRQKVFRRFYTA
ncbi:hypothetical protein [Zhongshania aquimaris]|uniref:OB domain-containing protein n=1 Tax=Zhongshania aquimaris TaxID=2857107 RepID=A0ABS6VSX6_9GAMM|nr:hypothetical protein [Zhongshania aquimaris]MBW2941376.1 hypothetical protein [Zhongshania aquimaris]